MEVCVDTVASARNAELGGAARLELCSALSEGGLTPSVGLLQVIKSLVSIPVFAMIRPRKGLDFVYSDEEVDVMEIDVKNLKIVGADGFVFGALTPSRQVDTRVCNRLLQAASPLPCTFHRAFDVLQNPVKELETVISLGFKRVLTSGQEESAFKGVNLISNLVKISLGRIIIVPGAGISKDNLEFVLREANVQEFHSSARAQVNVVGNYEGKENLSLGSSDKGHSLLITDKLLVEEMVKISEKVWSLNQK